MFKYDSLHQAVLWNGRIMVLGGKHRRQLGTWDMGEGGCHGTRGPLNDPYCGASKAAIYFVLVGRSPATCDTFTYQLSFINYQLSSVGIWSNSCLFCMVDRCNVVLARKLGNSRGSWLGGPRGPPTGPNLVDMKSKNAYKQSSRE